MEKRSQRVQPIIRGCPGTSLQPVDTDWDLNEGSVGKYKYGSKISALLLSLHLLIDCKNNFWGATAVSSQSKTHLVFLLFGLYTVNVISFWLSMSYDWVHRLLGSWKWCLGSLGSLQSSLRTQKLHSGLAVGSHVCLYHQRYPKTTTLIGFELLYVIQAQAAPPAPPWQFSNGKQLQNVEQQHGEGAQYAVRAWKPLMTTGTHSTIPLAIALILVSSHA